jgi:hypothetical protein
MEFKGVIYSLIVRGDIGCFSQLRRLFILTIINFNDGSQHESYILSC